MGEEKYVATAEEKKEALGAILETYECMSNGDFTPGTPTLMQAGTEHPQKANCNLLTMKDDSIEGIYGKNFMFTLKPLGFNST